MNLNSFEVHPAQLHSFPLIVDKICFHLLVLPLDPGVPCEDRGEYQEEKHDRRPQQPVHQVEIPVKEFVATKNLKLWAPCQRCSWFRGLRCYWHIPQRSGWPSSSSYFSSYLPIATTSGLCRGAFIESRLITPFVKKHVQINDHFCFIDFRSKLITFWMSWARIGAVWIKIIK